MTAHSFKDMEPENILAEYHALMCEAQEVLGQKEYNNIKDVHKDNIEALLWKKVTDEQPSAVAQLVQITEETLDNLYPDFVTNLNKIADFSSTEYKKNLVKIADELIKKLKEAIRNLLGIDLPDSLIKKYKGKILNLAQQIKQEKVNRKTIELGVDQVQWKFMCEYFISKIANEGIIPFDPKIIKRSMPVYPIFALYSKKIRKFAIDIQEYMESRLVSITSNLKIEYKNEEFKEVLRKSKDWVENLVKGIDEGKYGNEELCFIGFSVFISIIPFYSKGIVNASYYPSDRSCIYFLISKLKKYSPTSIAYRFINWRNFLIFEACLGSYLDLQKISELGAPRAKSINVYQYVTKKFDNLPKLLGDSLYKFMMENSEIKTSFYIENLAEEKRSPSVMLCVSGYLSEQDVSVEQWDGVIQSITDESISAYKWPAKSQLNLGKKIVKRLLPCMSELNKEGIVMTVLKSLETTHTTVFDDYKEASQRAKLAGRLLALMLSSGESFGNNTVVNLMGFSLGTKVIAECIKTLYKHKANNTICNVFLFGGAASFSNEEAWKEQLKVIGGRLVNCYSNSDWILKMLKESKNKRPIGLRPIFTEEKNIKVENYDVTNIAGGHLKYRGVFKSLLRQFYP